MATANQRQPGSSYMDTANEMVDEARNRAADTYHRAEDMVRDYPASSTLLAFGVGLGVGLLMAASMAPSRRRLSWQERHTPSWMSRESVADCVSRMVPDAVSRYLSK